MAISMNIVASMTQPVIMAETGEAGVEWVAVGKVPNGPDVRVGGQLQLVATWTRDDLRTALRTAIRDAVAGTLGSEPITGGRFVVLELL